MDGVGIVLAIIIVSFFSSFELRSFYPSDPLQQSTIRTVEGSYGTSGDGLQNPQVQRAPVEQAVPQSTTQDQVVPEPAQPAQPPPVANGDYSGIEYRFIAYDRMDTIIYRYNPNLSASDVNQIKMAANLYCKEKNIDPRIALAVMARESRFDPQAVSSSGAIGLGQIMPFNYRELGIDNPNDINQNVKGTVFYLSQKFNDWSTTGSRQLELGLASYLKGTGEIQRSNGLFDEHTRSYIDEILRIRASI